MGFFEKVKNMFTEEVEDDDVKVEKIKKEVTHVAIESPNAKETDELEQEKIVDDFKFKIEKESKPIFFDDNDFNDLNLTTRNEYKKKEEVKPVEVYHKPKEIEEKKVFKPTPIISPVYGILDKNYHKEDIVSRTDNPPIKESLEPSIDSIRNKAYGTLEDELENTLFGNNSILFKKDEDLDKEVLNDEQMTEVSDDILSDLTDDISKELDELLIKKEKYSDSELKKNIKKDDLSDDDLLEFIDSTLYKKGEDE